MINAHDREHRDARGRHDHPTRRASLGARVFKIVPKLWEETIETHRRSVRQAILDTTAGLVAEHGLRAVTMSQIAEQTGIGRATLYKYFPDVDAILLSWHEQQVDHHLEQLRRLAEQAGDPRKRLEAVLDAYAFSRFQRAQHERRHFEIAALVHRGEHIAQAERHLAEFLRGLLIECAGKGDVRDDVAADELASYCLHALAAASAVTSKAAVRRLVMVTIAGIRPMAVARRA